MLEMNFTDEDEPTTPGDMTWVPCNHIHSTKCPQCRKCEACREGQGMVLMPVTRRICP